MVKKSKIITNFINLNKKDRNKYLQKIVLKINSTKEEEKIKPLRSLLIKLGEEDNKKSEEEEDEKRLKEIIEEEEEKAKLTNELPVDPSDIKIDLQEEEKDEEKYDGPDAIYDVQTIIQALIKSQLPEYVEGNDEQSYKNNYLQLHIGEIEEEHKSDEVSKNGGKTQKQKQKKKKNKMTQSRLKQRTIKNKG